MKITAVVPNLLAISVLSFSLIGCEGKKEGSSSEAAEVAAEGWKSFLTVNEVADRIGQAGVVLLDARSGDSYAAGHIPGAISVPGSSLRTAKAGAGEGDSQYFFRAADGTPDVAKYEALFSKAGITADSEVIVYGGHAGKGDGTVAAMVLHWLGVEKVAFFDGIGLDLWSAAGKEVSTEATVLPEAKFVANAKPGFIMNLDAVVAATKDDSVYFMDTRSLEEYVGSEKRDNARGGHIPGAIRTDYAELLTDAKTVKSPTEIAALFESRGVPKDKPICMYCQTATRVSLNYFALKELGYDNVVIYDASWHEYGNVEGTPIVEGDSPE